MITQMNEYACRWNKQWCTVVGLHKNVLPHLALPERIAMSCQTVMVVKYHGTQFLKMSITFKIIKKFNEQ